MMCAMNEQATPSIRRIGRILFAIFVVVFLCIAAVVMAVWRAPLWVEAKFTEHRLAGAGIQSHTMRLDGMNIHYIEGGTGAPVVLIHGLGSYAERDWGALAPALVRAGYHIYAPDLPGFGESDKPAERTYSIPEQVKFVEDFLDARQLGGVVLGGESMGGWIVSALAIDAPQRVSKLMVFDSAGLNFKLSFDPALFTPETPEQVDQLMAIVTPNPPPAPGFVKAALIDRWKRNGWVTRRALLSMKEGHDFLDGKLSALKMPMLIVWGKQDVLTPLALGEETHRDAAQSTMLVFDGCGHIAAQTCADRVSPAVIDFLAGKGPAAGQRVDVPILPVE
jgi:pimeloyl-ACP methyl ester carboxylesterase